MIANPSLCAYCGSSLEKVKSDKFCSHRCKNNWSVSDWRRRTKFRGVEYLGGKCTKCGYSKCIAALQFHHRDKDKVFRLGNGKGRSWEATQAELDKCELVCNNCHAEEHWLSDDDLREERFLRARAKVSS